MDSIQLSIYLQSTFWLDTIYYILYAQTTLPLIPANNNRQDHRSSHIDSSCSVDKPQYT